MHVCICFHMVTVPHGVYDACTSCMHASILQKLKIHAEIYIHAYIITSAHMHHVLL